MSQAITIDDVRRARERIAGRVRATALARSGSLGDLAGQDVYLKCEQQQITGSFKLRGATNAIEALDRAARAQGVCAASSGNHGRALAHAARNSGARCVVCLSALAPEVKVEAIAALGAEVRVIGQDQDEAQAEVDRLVAEEAMVEISAFDNAQVIAGQGTLGLEIVEELPETECLIVPLSGGGLIAGVALAAKSIKPSIRVVGVTMERGPAMYESQKAGRPVPVEEVPTLADALGGGIGDDNRYTFAMVRDLVDDILLVGEAEIAAAIRHAYFQERQIVEGGGAVGLAALLAGRVRPAGPTVVVLSGGNIDMTLHHRLIGGEDVDLA